MTAALASAFVAALQVRAALDAFAKKGLLAPQAKLESLLLINTFSTC